MEAIMFKNIKDYFKNVKDNDPAAHSYWEVLLYPTVHAVALYRVANKLYELRMFFIARFISQFARLITGIEIHPGATIGKALFIDHGMGVVIGETSVIGDYVTIYQGVTLGGTGKDKGKRHPSVGDRVVIGAGAKILGPIHLASGSKIGAGSVVLTDTRTESTVVGVPARVIGGRDSAVIPIEMYKEKVQIYNDMVI
jgi:serine O-acetyltransferase